MPEKLPYASLPALEQAVRARLSIGFTWKGTRHQAEVHKLTRATRTGAIIAQAWIAGLGWRNIPYCEIRGMEVLSEHFDSRKIPAGTLARIA